MAEPASATTSEDSYAVSVEGADIKYRVYEDHLDGARAVILGRLRSRTAVTVHAVKDVSFSVAVGESIGVVGSNGSGKSTLLRAIAGLQSLDAGRIRVRGDAHLLGVAAALKPSLSGRRNVVLGGLAMGLSRSEVEAAMPEIIEFSGLDDAMARPMNTYSSGMRARLAFSIATMRVPDVLLIDEALAVGDKEFRERSLKKIRSIQERAGTVMMVTHNLNEIRRTCTRALWINQGILVEDGPVEDVLHSYETSAL